eukprot:Rmarinus@m.12493
MCPYLTYMVYLLHLLNQASRTVGPTPLFFELYREGSANSHILRGILPTKHSYKLAEEILYQHTPGYDYAVILVNDPYYGGLGDDIAIISSSPTSGALALRHELAHNFADVGEEYDSGGDYSGPNCAFSLIPCNREYHPKLDRSGGYIREKWECLPWGHWVDGLEDTNAAVTPLDATMPLAEYPWKVLDPAKAGHAEISFEFNSDGALPYNSIHFSMSGVSTGSKISVNLNGISIEFTPVDHVDRAFYTYSQHVPFLPGTNKLSFSKLEEDKLTSVLCHVMVHEYSYNPNTQPNGPSGVAAFPDFSDPGHVVGYRPTHGECLMREMDSNRLCSVCQERVWLKLLARSRLARDVSVESIGESSFSLEASLPTLGKYREHRVLGTSESDSNLSVTAPTETLMVTWYDGPEFIGSGDNVVVSTSDRETACIELRVRFTSSEIRRGYGVELPASYSYETVILEGRNVDAVVDRIVLAVGGKEGFSQRFSSLDECFQAHPGATPPPRSSPPGSSFVSTPLHPPTNQKQKNVLPKSDSHYQGGSPRDHGQNTDLPLFPRDPQLSPLTVDLDPGYGMLVVYLFATGCTAVFFLISRTFRLGVRPRRL